MSIFYGATARVIGAKNNAPAAILLLNGAVAIVVFAMYVATAVTSDANKRDNFALGGALLTAIVAILQSSGFAVYGSLAVASRYC